MKRFLTTLALTSSVLGSTAFARPILMGTDVVAGEYREVYLLERPVPNVKDRVFHCTSVLIRPRVLLTAAHCLPKSPTEKYAYAHVLSPNDPTRFKSVVGYVGHPNFNAGAESTDVDSAYDIAIVLLPEDQGAKPAGIASLDQVENLVAAAREIQVVGFGGKDKVSGDPTSGTLRKGKSRAIDWDGKILRTNGLMNAVAQGDSGGPAFIVDAEGNRRVVAIASATPANAEYLDPKSGLPLLSYYTGIRAELVDWIERSIAELTAAAAAAETPAAPPVSDSFASP